MKRFWPFLFAVSFLACKHQELIVNEGTTAPAPVVSAVSGNTWLPFAYFQFEKGQQSVAAKKKIVTTDWQGKGNTANALLPLDDHSGLIGSCWNSGGAIRRTVLQLNDSSQRFYAHPDAFTIELGVRLDPDSMDNIRLGFSETQIVISPQAILFALVDSAGKTDAANQLRIDNNGSSALSGLLYDGNWHHLAFIFSGNKAEGKGVLRFMIDGMEHPLFNKRVNRTSSSCGKRFTLMYVPAKNSSMNRIDELAIWFDDLPGKMIAQHAADFFGGRHYSFTLNPRAPEVSVFTFQKKNFNDEDFAPGFPQYTVSQKEQLNTFPLPRFRPGTDLQRNFPWFDFSYLSYNYDLAKRNDQKKFKYPGWDEAVHAKEALAIDTEMYVHWNYLFLIPTPTYNHDGFLKPGTVCGALADYANRHPDVKTATVLFWVGTRPDRAGFDSKKPYIRSNANINPCTGDTVFANIQKDGITQRKNLQLLIRALPNRDSLRKIDFVNENGEVFGEGWTPNAEGYRGSPFISCIQKDSATARATRAKWQYQVFHAYTSQFVNTREFPALLHSDFSFYQVAGFMPPYYSEFSVMRKINARFRGMYYSTPDFYPGHQGWDLWSTHGPYHGLDVIEEGRKNEIALGDNYFSPFVCAGWFNDSMNFRPAEWLAAMKALAMMGAEFYYPSYFNTVNPSDKKPQDPRGYIYQVAIPVYAQAITSRYESVFFHSKDFTYNRNFNRLVVYRKDSLNPVYAITAAVFPGANYAGSGEEDVSGNISIDHDLLKINFREQGSTYIYDKTDPEHIVFYQLDGWHEDKHPYYWSRNFDFEAELHDDSNRVHLRTEQPPGVAPGNYTHFTTYVYFTSNAEAQQPLQFNFEPRASDTAVYYIWVRARSSSPKGSGLKLAIDEEPAYEVKDVSPEEFRWYCVSVKGKPVKVSVTAGQEHHLFLSGTDRFIEIDRVVLSTVAVPDFVGNSR